MARHTLNTFKMHLLQDFLSESDHFKKLCIKGLRIGLLLKKKKKMALKPRYRINKGLLQISLQILSEFK